MTNTDSAKLAVHDLGAGMSGGTTRIPTDDPEVYYLNMGPQHPSMHGVLRILLKMKGEQILEAEPIIGYAHRAHEKMAENRKYAMFFPNSSRLDYLSGMICNIGYCQAVEKALQITVEERALYIRVIANELNRIASHLLWFGTFVMDLGGITPFLYSFEDREEILAILDRVTGSRLTYAYGRFGGVTRDIDDTFCEQTLGFIGRIRERIPLYQRLVGDNVIFRERCEGVGVIDKAHALKYNITGPTLRAAGVSYDVRKDEPYGAYDRFDFEVPTATSGDSMDRFHVRVAEMEQSARIIEQAIAGLPEGLFQPKRPVRVTKPKAGEYYFACESARGHFGYYIVSDGTEIPFKLKVRPPSFSNLASMVDVLKGTPVADLINIVGSIDIVMPEIDR